MLPSSLTLDSNWSMLSNDQRASDGYLALSSSSLTFNNMDKELHMIKKNSKLLTKLKQKQLIMYKKTKHNLKKLLK